MKIDTHHGWFKGLGDIACYAWLGAGLLAAGSSVTFAATGWRAEALRFWQMPVTDDFTGAEMAYTGYETAVRTGSPLNYLEWIAADLGVLATPVRPHLDLSPMDREMGRAASARVLVFPHGHWASRVWPRNYFVELCLLLRGAGIDFAVVTLERDAAFTAFRCIYGRSISFVAAACQAAQLVIGNDSGPAHLAGTVGTRVLAIQGPTTGRIFAHLPEVESLRVRTIGCSGCHCLTPFRASCEFGCHELYRTSAETVFQHAGALLRKP